MAEKRNKQGKTKNKKHATKPTVSRRKGEKEYEVGNEDREIAKHVSYVRTAMEEGWGGGCVRY
jgi:hypothetical protein